MVLKKTLFSIQNEQLWHDKLPLRKWDLFIYIMVRFFKVMLGKMGIADWVKESGIVSNQTAILSMFMFNQPFI